MVNRVRAGRTVVAAVAASLTALSAGSLWAASERPFFDFDPLHGDIGFRYDRTMTTTSSSAGTAVADYGFSYEDLNLRQGITVYHPRFLVLNLGAGLSLSQGHGDAAGRDATLNRYDLTADLLRMHPYSLNVHTRKDVAEYVHSPTDVTFFDRTDSGARLMLKDELGLPMSLTLSANRTRTESQDFYRELTELGPTDQHRLVSGTTESSEVTAVQRWTALGLDLGYSGRRVHEEHTSPSTPILIDYEQIQYHARAFGPGVGNGRMYWRLNVDGQSQSDQPRYREMRADGELGVKLIENFYTSLDVTLAGSGSENIKYLTPGPGTEDTLRVEMRRASAGLSHRLFKSLFTAVTLSRSGTTYPDYENEARSRSLSVQYRKDIPEGSVQASVGLTRSEDENTGSEVVSVFDDPYALTGFNPVVVGTENVLLTAPYLVVVTDQTGSILYAENLDYRIYQIGTLTYLERIPGTSIGDGETVLVDYSFSAARRVLHSRTKSYALQVNWRSLSPYLRLTRREQWVVEGTDPNLNPGKQTIAGIRMRSELWPDVTGEFNAEAEANTQRIDPYDQFRYDGSLAFLLSPGVGSKVYLSRTVADHEEPVKDSDRKVLGAELTYRRGRYSASLEGSAESSEVGSSEREAFIVKTGGEVAYGQWILSGSVRTAWESYRVAPDVEGYDGRSYSLVTGLKRTF